MKQLFFAMLFCLVSLYVFAEGESTNSPAEIAKIKKTMKMAAEEASSSGPEVVKVGLYLNDVQNIDVHNNNYLLDFLFMVQMGG